MVQCAQCKQPLEISASMSGSVMGDEYIESWCFCPACQVYTLEVWRDRFCGEDSINLHGPVSKANGDAKVKLIQSCVKPWDKKCRCKAHRAYFGHWLD
jgi:hypothetical protein